MTLITSVKVNKEQLKERKHIYVLNNITNEKINTFFKILTPLQGVKYNY